MNRLIVYVMKALTWIQKQLGLSSYNPQRPLIHFAPGLNWINDPNGCVYFDGSYHLNFQYHPHGIQWGPMHWGHAVSRDLLSWEEKGIALYPDKETGMAFSGSAVIDSDNTSGFHPDGPGLLAFYTGHIRGKAWGKALQQQCLAHSPDGGLTWKPYAGNPVVPNPGIPDFRDPKVFRHAPSGAWVMVVVAGREVLFYRSRNLVDWEAAGRFGDGYGLPEGIWECPDLFALPDPRNPARQVWVLTVSILGRTKPEFSPVQYFLGDFDGHQFLCDHPASDIRLLDYGHDFYATQSWFGLEDQDRTVWIAWANHWAYANDIPATDWRGVMSLPRELSLGVRDDRLHIKQVPVRELDDRLIAAPLPDRATSDGVHDIRLRVPCTDEGFAAVRFRFGSGDLQVRWDATDRRLTIDRSEVSRLGYHPEFHKRPSVHLVCQTGEMIDIRIILDRSIVEVFTLDGLVTMTSQIFPGTPVEEISIESSPEVEIRNAEHRVIDLVRKQ